MKSAPPIDALLNLPDHLRQSLITVCKIGFASASDVAQETGKARAVESSYLNQLARLGYLRKTRKGKNVLFYTNSFTLKREAITHEILEQINKLPPEHQITLAKDLLKTILNKLQSYNQTREKAKP